MTEPVGANFWRGNLPLLPAAIFAVLALVLGIAPQALFGFGANLAASDLLPAGAFVHNVNVTPTGFILPTGQWIPTIAWAIVLILVIVFVLLRTLIPATIGDVDVLESEDSEDAVVVADGDTEVVVAEMEESASLAAPTEVWDQLAPAFASEWLQPGAFFLLDGTDDDDDDTDGEASEEDAVDDDSPDDKDAAVVLEQDQADDSEPAEQNGSGGAGTAPRSKSAKRIKDNGV